METVSFLGYELTKAIHNIVGVHMITVFTPTYNRVHTIVRTFESLQAQTDKDFEWVVVDDGSSDNTLDVLTQLKEKAEFPVIFQYQKNAGKHVAINLGVQMARGELFFIVDSDDWLKPNAISTIKRLIAELPATQKYAGISGVDVTPEGDLIGTSFSSEYVDCTSFERARYNINGDKAEVFYTSILRKFPFPSFEGENFLTESVVWYRIADAGYKIRWTNEPFYVCDYQNGGLSATTGKCSRNFKGYQLTTKEMLGYKELPYKARVGQLIAYAAIACKEKKNIKACADEINHPYLLVLILGKIGYATFRIKNAFRRR